MTFLRRTNWNNASKTEMVYFSKTRTLEFEDSASILGLKIDSHLNWEKHCTKVANIISQNNSMINRVKNMPPHLTMKILYYSFIQPHLQYGSTVWGGCSNQKKKRVVAIQKRSVRTICKVYFTSHTEPKMKKVDILKLDDLYKQQCLVNVHSCVHETAPWPIT